MKQFLQVFFLILVAQTQINAQVTFPQNGAWDSRQDFYVFINAKIVVDPTTTIDSATMVIKEGKIISIGKNIAMPIGATIINVEGKFIYPSFIDIYSNYGMPDTKSGPRNGGDDDEGSQQRLSNRKGAYAWNEALRSDFEANKSFVVDANKAKDLSDLGFGAVNTIQLDGISRGISSVVLLGTKREHEMMVKAKASHELSFRKGSSSQDYPGSLMGSIALLRQTYLDGDWYAKEGYKKEFNISLSTWNDVQALPQIFEAGDKTNILRAQKIGKEFNKSYIFKGGGNEYQLLDEIYSQDVKNIILPINFPNAYEVEDPLAAESIDLSDLKHWDLAPSNPSRLLAKGISIALTTDGLQKKSEFKAKVLDAIKAGLKKEDALKALTITPATWLGVQDQLGTLSAGKLANFFICNNEYFTKDSKILQNWVKGIPVLQKDISAQLETGNYKLTIDSKVYDWKVEEDAGKLKTNLIQSDTSKISVSQNINQKLISLQFAPTKGSDDLIRLSGTINGKSISGVGQLTDGSWINWSAVKNDDVLNKPIVKDTLKTDGTITEINHPWIGFGWIKEPLKEEYLIKNATVWTNEKEGILKDEDVLIKGGKIVKIGKNISSNSAILIDGKNKHLTAGIIDEHSHIAIAGGVNECTQAVTAEVRIGDVVNCDDVNIYRQLAGGVTGAQLLHGSCNPVGGQSALIKLRWGFAPEKMKIEGADGYIKFALGENVKQSRNNNNSRFPDSRMGVEQVYEDAFTRAEEYLVNRSNTVSPQRRDLEMEALVEILTSKRFITCHSYVQSEINMLMKVADRHKFRVNTFTHILEGYKVADKMKKHGVGASSFSDWWAYKMEVYDAIPYNGAIMHDVGVTVAFNSDDPEMARRLNQEAAKAVKYGSLSEEEALKFVTLNPAKLLHLDNRTGSIKEGKDADVVLWSDNPLSMYTVAEITWVDGMKLFDRKEMVANKIAIDKERNRLIQKMILAKKGGAKTDKFSSPKKILYECDTVEENEYNHN